MTTLNAELYDALIAIKVPEEKARAAAATIPPSELLVKKTDIPPKEQIATKADIQALNTRITMLMWMGGIAFAGVFTLLGVVISLIV